MEKRKCAISRTIYFIFLLLLFLSLPVTFAAELNLTYDNNGNLISGDGKYRTYNEFNQLIRIQENNLSGVVLEEYIYHPLEDRILAKRVYTSYESEGHIITDLKEVAIYANDNLVRTSVFLSASTINTSDKIYVKDENGFVAEFNSDQSKIFYHNDHLGSTSVLTNNSGGIAEQTFYEPFGGIISGGNISRFYYEGKDYSPVINEYDFNFRKYNPDLLIFTKPDSVTSNIYDPQLLNRYAFERNNPYKYVDSDGKNPLLIIGVASGIGALVGAGFYGLEVYNGDLTFSLGGLGAYTAGGLITGGAGALGFAYYLGLVTTVVIGTTSSVISQGIINLGTNKPLTQGFVKAAEIGGISAGLSVFFPSTNGLKNIKYLNSFFTKPSGKQFVSNIFASEIFSSGISTGNNALQLIYNYASSQIDITQQINTGGSYNSATGVYCDKNSCQSTAFPQSASSSSGSRGSGGRNNNKLPNDYCSTHSDYRCP